MTKEHSLEGNDKIVAEDSLLCPAIGGQAALLLDTLVGCLKLLVCWRKHRGKI